jgi:hypothetical protein
MVMSNNPENKNLENVTLFFDRRKGCYHCFFFIFAFNDLMNRNVIDVLSNCVYSISLLLIIELYHSLSSHCCTRDDSNARSASRKLMTLALLPINQVELAFNDIATDSLHCTLWNVAELGIYTNNNVRGTCLSFSSIKLLFLALFLLG